MSVSSTCSYAVYISSVIVPIGELFGLRVEDSPLYAFLFNIVLYWFTRTLDGLEFAAVIREELLCDSLKQWRLLWTLFLYQ